MKILGNFVFNETLVINKNLYVLGNLNEVDLSMWLSSSINTNTLRKQVVNKKLMVYGNVIVKQNVTGSGQINGQSIPKLASEFQTEKARLESSALNKMVKA